MPWAIRTYELFYTNRFGQEIWRELRGTDAGYDVPQFSIHRGRLQAVIWQAVRARLGESRIHTGHRLGAFRQDEGGVTAYFFDRHGSQRAAAHGDVLVGADGIHSLVRDTLYPSEGAAQWNGAMLWRGAVEWPTFLTGRSMVIAGGMAAKLVVYPIAEAARPDRRLTNWAVVARVGDRLDPAAQQGGLVATGAFRRSDAARPAISHPLRQRAGVDRGDARILGISDVRSRSPAALVAWPRHVAGRCRASDVPGRLQRRIPGDPRRPLPRRSACSRPSTCCTALWMYEQERLPMTAQIVRMNRKGGPEGVIDAVEERAPDGFSSIDDVLSFEQRKAIVRGYASTAGFAQEQVNKAA